MARVCMPVGVMTTSLHIKLIVLATCALVVAICADLPKPAYLSCISKSAVRWHADCVPGQLSNARLLAEGNSAAPDADADARAHLAIFGNKTVVYNAAMCEGDPSVHASETVEIVGTLNCHAYKKESYSECRDNLAAGKIFIRNGCEHPDGKCERFSHEYAFKRRTSFCTPKGLNKLTQNGITGPNGTKLTSYITKMVTMHPHHADKTVGLIFGKRVVCYNMTGDLEKCEVFKKSHCIKCANSTGFDWFAHKAEQYATYNETARFVDCCVRGKTTWMMGERKQGANSIKSEYQCPHETHGTTPFYSNGTLKAEYECSPKDYKIASNFVKAA